MFSKGITGWRPARDLSVADANCTILHAHAYESAIGYLTMEENLAKRERVPEIAEYCY
jgi:hypothetical protein